MLKVSSVKQEDTAWDKEIAFTYKGANYRVILHWDKWDGYELVTFLDSKGTWIDEPDWAIEWEDNNEESLNYTLDSLSDEKLKEN